MRPALASDQIMISLTREELLVLAGSVNEAINAVEDWEFSTRLGAGKSAFRELRNDPRGLVAELLPVE